MSTLVDEKVAQLVAEKVETMVAVMVALLAKWKAAKLAVDWAV